jgi:cell division protein FtsZ
MIQIHRNSNSAPDVRIKVVGLGGAGGNVLDRLQLDGLHDAELIAINSDAQALTASVVEQKVQLGRNTTRGLGAGGDPEIGYAAADEGVEEIRRAIEGAQLVFLCVGLGGGTGSGGARIVASLAREQHSLVISFATLPFSFEGKRRRAQADEALIALQRYSDVVIHFENDKMGDSVAPLAGIHEAFKSADLTLSQSIRSIIRLVRQRGLVNIGFDEVATALRGASESGSHCVFGYGEADGDNRAHEALARALKNPLMDKGRMLESARNVLVNIAGGPSMTLNEVHILMEELNRHISDQTRVLFGTAVDQALGQKVSVTILSALQGEAAPVLELKPRPAPRVESSPVSVSPAPVISAPVAEPEVIPHVPEPVVVPRVREPVVVKRAPEPVMVPREPEPEPEPEPVFLEPAAVNHAPAVAARATTRFAEPEPELEPEPEPAPPPAPKSVPVAEPAKPPAPTVAAKTAKPKPVAAKQEQMQFEPVTRGRFEKSEPTIVDGQDLDVPTFLRRNVKVK